MARAVGTAGQILINEILPEDMRDYQRTLDKKGVGKLLSEVAQRYPEKYRDISFQLGKLGQQAAYRTGGFSFGVRHLQKTQSGTLRRQALQEKLNRLLDDDSLPDDKRETKILALMNDLMEKQPDEILAEAKATGNPLADQLMGAGRGNKMSLASMLGSDGLYQDHHENIIPVPVLRSYSQGLSPMEYWAGTYGARRGVLATKFCLSAGTEVLMADCSSRPIEAIAPGDSVMTLDDDNRLVPTRVTAVFDNGPKLCNEYLFREGRSRELVSVTATADHQIYAQYRGSSGVKSAMTPLGEMAIGRKSAVVPAGIGEPDVVREYDSERQVGMRRTYDLEVEHPSHRFVLSNMLVVSNSTRDAGYLCLAEGTMVQLPDGGAIAIENIAAGDTVLGADSAGRTFPVTVTNTFDNGAREVWDFCFRIGKSRNGYISIRATDDHRVLALLRRGRPGTPHGDKQSISMPTQLPLSRTGTGFRLVPTQGMIDFAGAREPRALLLGLLLGDGGLSGSTVYLSAADPVLIRNLEPYLRELGLYLRWRGEAHPYEYAVLDYARDRCGKRNRLRTWLRELGVLGHKANTKQIPQEVYGWDQASVAALLAGLFETDGCIASIANTTVPFINLAMCSKQIVETVRELLALRFGIHTPPVRRYPPVANGNYPIYVLAINNRDGVQKFAAAIPLPGRKRQILQSLLDSMAPATRADDFVYSFVGKTYVGFVNTYDIEVDHPEHLFVLANGAIVSNSKQLNQIAHRFVVVDEDAPQEPDTLQGLPVDTDDDDSEGALLAAPVGKYKRNTVLTPKIIRDLREQGVKRILVRSPVVSGAPDGGVYGRDVGVREFGHIPVRGENVGLAAAQALSEPLSQGQLCLAAGTLVRMADRTAKPIEQIVTGDSVLGADRYGQTFPASVVAVYDNGTRECVRTVFGSNHEHELICTQEHKLLGAFDDGNGEAEIDLAILPLGKAMSARRVFFAVRIDDDGKAVRFTAPSCPEPVGVRRTYDIEVDHPDHLFVLANGLIVSNSAKHGGGVAGQTKAVSGFEAVDQLIQVPKTFKDGAAHSTVDGIVQSVEPAPAGGTYITIDGTKHYVASGFNLLVKKGDRIEAGDVLSEGMPNPALIVQYKGIGEGRRYFVNSFREALRNANVNAHRRNVEVLARGLINHVRLTDEIDDFAPDDIVQYNTLAASYKPREGHKILKPAAAVGQYLEKPYLHYTIGTRIRPSMLKDFSEFGVGELAVHPEPPPFEPEMIRGMSNLQHDPDWMVRMLGSGLKGSLLSAVQRGSTSDERGTSFVPARARAVDFGHIGVVRTPKKPKPGTIE